MEDIISEYGSGDEVMLCKFSSDLSVWSTFHYQWCQYGWGSD